MSGWPAPPGPSARVFEPGPPLPSSFRLSPDGHPVPVRWAGAHGAGGHGAEQGRAESRVVHDAVLAARGDVLVTRTLDPRLAGWPPTLGAVVSETGSVLSHLAILAREYTVPTVVGVHDAVEWCPTGTRPVVDGTTGEVRPTGVDDGGRRREHRTDTAPARATAGRGGPRGLRAPRIRLPDPSGVEPHPGCSRVLPGCGGCAVHRPGAFRLRTLTMKVTTAQEHAEAAALQPGSAPAARRPRVRSHGCPRTARTSCSRSTSGPESSFQPGPPWSSRCRGSLWSPWPRTN